MALYLVKYRKNFTFYLKEISYMDGNRKTGSGSCPIGGFDISDTVTSGSAIRGVISFELLQFHRLLYNEIFIIKVLLYGQQKSYMCRRVNYRLKTFKSSLHHAMKT